MKKILALVMVVAMLACFASVTSAAAPAGQIAWYGMDGNDAGLTVNGENVTYADGVATLGDATWFTADVDVKGLDELTVALKVLVSDTDANWGFEVTSEDAHTYPAEHYLGVLLNSGFTVERYNNTNARPAAGTGTIVTGEWMDLVCVFPADGSVIVYINGEEVANVPQTEGYDLALAACYGENPEFKIGKANWGEGEFAANTSFDTVAVYNRALAADEVATALDQAEEADAPQTGFATVALAVVAIASGAYVVTKKH